MKKDNRRSMFRTIFGLLIITMLVSVNTFAATTNIGSTTHTYTSAEPFYCRIQGDVEYSYLYSSLMTITHMRSRIWNYSSSSDDMTAPTFIVEDTNVYHSTNYSSGYNGLVIPPGTSNFYTNVNWYNFTGGNNSYTIPITSYYNTMYTYIGAYVGDYYDSTSYPYYYSAYWHGNGYVKIYDYVANSPYSWSKNVSTVTNAGSGIGNTDVVYNVHYNGCVGNYSSFEIEAVADYGIQFITFPVIALDKEFIECPTILSDNIIIDDNKMIIYVEGDYDEKEVYIKLPDVTVLDNDFVSETELLSLRSTDYYDKESEQRILQLEYSKAELPVIPQDAALHIADQLIESVWTNAFYDANNNLISGTLNFYIAEDFVIPEQYALTLTGRLVDVEGDICSVKCLK